MKGVGNMPKKNWLVILLVMVFTVAFGSVCGAAETGVLTGQLMPAFTLNDVDGQPVTVAPSDKVTIINFWATWCPPCRQEMPELNRFYQKNSDKVNFYTVNLREPAGSVRAFLGRNNLSLPTLLDADGSIGSQFAVRYIPTTIVVDRDGIIQFRKSGGMTMAELEAVVDKI
jgi:Thiol-disulfide isomerase and thioredoxins